MTAELQDVTIAATGGIQVSVQPPPTSTGLSAAAPPSDRVENAEQPSHRTQFFGTRIRKAMEIIRTW